MAISIGQINIAFGEIGWAIGCLKDSTPYDDAFLSIADRVQAMGGGVKQDRTSLYGDMMGLAKKLEGEGAIFGFNGERLAVEKPKKQRVGFFAVMNRWRCMSYSEFWTCCISLLVLIIGISLLAVSIPRADVWYKLDGVRYESRNDVPEGKQHQAIEYNNLAVGGCVLGGMAMFFSMIFFPIFFFLDGLYEIKQARKWVQKTVTESYTPPEALHTNAIKSKWVSMSDAYRRGR